jgi:hypothetical protein
MGPRALAISLVAPLHLDRVLAVNGGPETQDHGSWFIR